METRSSDKLCCNVAWTWQIILGWSRIVLRFVTKTFGARSKSVGGFSVRWFLRSGRGADVCVGAGLGPPRQRLAGAGVRQSRPLRVQGRRWRAVPLRAVLHRVPPHLEVDPPGAGCLLEDEEVLPPDLLLRHAAGVCLRVRGHIGLVVHGLDHIAVLEILLGGAAIKHPLDDLWWRSPGGALEAGSPVSWAGEDDVTDNWDRGDNGLKWLLLNVLSLVWTKFCGIVTKQLRTRGDEMQILKWMMCKSLCWICRFKIKLC